SYPATNRWAIVGRPSGTNRKSYPATNRWAIVGCTSGTKGKPLFLHGIEYQARKHLGVEIGRLGRHFFQAAGNRFHMIHGGWRNQSSEVTFLGGQGFFDLVKRMDILALG